MGWFGKDKDSNGKSGKDSAVVYNPKCDSELFKDWNFFVSVAGLLDESALKYRADFGLKSGMLVNRNLPDTIGRLGDSGIIAVEYTPQTVYPSLCFEDTAIYATPKGVYYGKNKRAAEALDAVPRITTPVIKEDILTLSELVNSGRKPEFIWDYLTDEELDKGQLVEPLNPDSLGLERGNWVDLYRFISGENKDLPEYWVTDKMLRGAKEIKMITDLDEITPAVTLALYDALKRGASVEIITGPEIYLPSTTHDSIYKHPVKLAKGYELSFKDGNMAVISSGGFAGNETHIGDYDRCGLLTYLARESKKPIMARIAAQACEEAIKKDNKNSGLFSLLAINQWNDANPLGAFQACEEAYNLAKGSKGYSGVCSDLSFACSKIGRHIDGTKAAQEAIALDKNIIYAHNNLATNQHLLGARTGKTGHCRDAETNYLLELEIKPDHPYAERMLGQVQRLEKLLA